MADTAKGQPDGLATLDTDGDVPVTQMPDEVALDAELGALALLDTAAFVADADALTSAAAVGANPTDDEFDALLLDVTALRGTVNELLAALIAAGQMDAE